MDIISFNEASTANERVQRINANPDSDSGIVTVPKKIEAGESVTVPAGRVAVLPNVQVEGTLTVDGEVFIPSGATFGDLESQIALKAPLASPALTGTPTINGVNVSGYSGFKNYIINGNFDIWQRGTGPFTNFNYGADRWIVYNDTATMSSSSTSSNGVQKRIAHIQNVTAGKGFLGQAIELPLVGFGHPFVVGKKFTVSVRYSSTTKIRPLLIFRNGVVGANPVELDSSMTSPAYKGGSGVDETVSWTFTVDGTAASTNTCLVLSLIAESNASHVYMYQVQLEEGSVATPFEHRPYGLELSLCQRYYQVFNLGLYNNLSITTTLGGAISFPTPMRVIPTLGLIFGVPVVYQNPTLYGTEYYSQNVGAGLWNIGHHYASAEL